MGIRIIPNIPKIRAIWTRRSSEIPDRLRVPFMGDRVVVNYYPEVEQPSFLKSLEIIRNMTDPRIGYQRKGPRDEADIRPVDELEKPWLV